MEITYEPIGKIRSPFKEPEGTPWGMSVAFGIMIALHFIKTFVGNNDKIKISK